VPATNGWEAYKKNLKFGEIKLVLKKPKQVEKDKILTIRTVIKKKEKKFALIWKIEWGGNKNKKLTNNILVK